MPDRDSCFAAALLGWSSFFAVVSLGERSFSVAVLLRRGPCFAAVLLGWGSSGAAASRCRGPSFEAAVLGQVLTSAVVRVAGQKAGSAVLPAFEVVQVDGESSAARQATLSASSNVPALLMLVGHAALSGLAVPTRQAVPACQRLLPAPVVRGAFPGSPRPVGRGEQLEVLFARVRRTSSSALFRGAAPRGLQVGSPLLFGLQPLACWVPSASPGGKAGRILGFGACVRPMRGSTSRSVSPVGHAELLRMGPPTGDAWRLGLVG